MPGNYLYQDIESAKNWGQYKEIPDFLLSSLNPLFDLRPYQQNAFRNYITYFETSFLREKTRQVLFHMATGSGKTLIMAGLIAYLFKQGYRNFLFFVNRNIIIKKTKENFLNPASPKYQFNPELYLDGRKVPIIEVENFDSSEPDSINICFNSIQKLHGDLFNVKENSLSIEDFKDKKIVLISDEAHHLNAATLTSAEQEDNRQWEITINRILNANIENILLEFTATCKFESNPLLLDKYENKVVFDYPLSKFREDKYSKSIQSITFSDSTAIDRAIVAVIMSEFRLKLFHRNGIDIKPVIMFKSKTIAESKAFMSNFINRIQLLQEDEILSIAEKYSKEEIKLAFDFFSTEKIELSSLVAEIKQEFSKGHCISANEEKDAERNQLLLNSLEEKNNPYRAVFAVDKLNEGWDVLNLFDIVRVAETVGGANDTNAEAQLIGRGARYCPFRLTEDQNRFQRKYDHDINNPLRICETLLYHCINESHYISRLNQALKESGAIPDNLVQRKLLIKDKFKKTDFYINGLVFVNSRKEVSRKHITSLPDEAKAEHRYTIQTGEFAKFELLGEKINETSKSLPIKSSRFTVSELSKINYGIVHRAIRRTKDLSFDKLKRLFPNLTSTRSFLTSKEYLGNSVIVIQSQYDKDNLPIYVIEKAISLFLNDISTYISRIEIEYEGTKEFYAKNISSVIRDRVMNFTNPSGEGEGVSQNSMEVSSEIRLDLSQEDWYVFNDNFGTPEEKAFVRVFKSYVDELEKKYKYIYLIRNEKEKELATYSFKGGQLFEPDYILFLKTDIKDDRNEQIQIFIEPKGDGYIANDLWKEEFLLELEKEGVPIIKFVDNTDYRIRGFHFFNRKHRTNEFETDMKSIL